MNEWVVVLRFVVSPEQRDTFRGEATEVARLLAAQAGCRGIEIGRASDDPSLWVMSSRWESVGHYRRALSTFEVKMHGVPLLSRAVDEPTAFEVLFAVDAEGEHAASGDLAGDAGTVDRSR